MEAIAALHNRASQSPRERERTLGRPLRAPMIIVVIATRPANARLPEVEQLLSAGAAMQNLLNAAYAEGVGAIWRTGDAANVPFVKAGLGVGDGGHIVGFLYLHGWRTAPTADGCCGGFSTSSPQTRPHGAGPQWTQRSLPNPRAARPAISCDFATSRQPFCQPLETRLQQPLRSGT